MPKWMSHSANYHSAISQQNPFLHFFRLVQLIIHFLHCILMLMTLKSMAHYYFYCILPHLVQMNRFFVQCFWLCNSESITVNTITGITEKNISTSGFNSSVSVMRERPHLTKYEKIKSYILLKSITEKVFIGIFSFSGSKRTGKYCARIFSYILGHPNMQFKNVYRTSLLIQTRENN
jgi:hypothetical protein